jgi:flagellar motor switch protein FliN
MISRGLLSQAEIDALLSGGASSTPELKESEKDLLGEIGNIAMGSASTALSTIIGKTVNITTPKVTVTNLNQIRHMMDIPNIALEVFYTEGLEGANLLIMKVTDASVIADLMMGKDGSRRNSELTEIEISAVSEAMNQMVGSTSTALATILNTPINISPPQAKLWINETSSMSDNINESDNMISIAFKLTIEELIDSEVMLLLQINTAKGIIDRMTQSIEEPEQRNTAKDTASYRKPSSEVKKAQFAPLTPMTSGEQQNIDLILDVPLDISVILGRTKKTIKEILELGTGSVVELDKLTEEPVEILVNGKKVAYGELVVVDEHFGVRITSIVSNAERVKSLKGN